MHVHIRSTLYQGDTILRLAEMCRKLETEEEKVCTYLDIMMNMVEVHDV